MTPKTTAKKAEPDTSTVQTTEVKEAPAKTTVRKTRTTAKKTTEKPVARGLCKGCFGKCEEDLDRRNGQERQRSEGC